MDIKAADVKALRDATGAGMMDAKKALVDAGGDIEAAKQLLREKGVVRAGKLSERSAEEGVVAAHIDRSSGAPTTGVLLELNCATDFVAKTDRFRQIADDLAALAASSGVSDVDALMAQPAADGKSVADLLTSVSSEVGEPVRVRRLARFETAGSGIVDAYLHQPDTSLPPKVGVLIELDSTADGGALATAARDVSLHIAAMRPTYVGREEVPADEVAKERDFLTNQARESGKPENVIEKMVEGRLRDFFAQIALLDQPYVRDDKVTVAVHLGTVSKEVGAPVTVARFARFRVGAE